MAHNGSSMRDMFSHFGRKSIEPSRKSTEPPSRVESAASLTRLADVHPAGRSTSALTFRSEDNSTYMMSTTNAAKCDVMIQYLRQRQLEKLWSDGELSEGVVLKRTKNDFICQPPELSSQAFGFYDEIKKLNVKVAMTVKTPVIQTFLREYMQSFAPLKNGLQLQILPNIASLSRCKKHHYGAFVRDISTLIVWEDDAVDIIRRTEQIEQQLVEMIWTNGRDHPLTNEKLDKDATVNVEEVSDEHLEDGYASGPRPVVLLQAILTACAAIIIIFSLSVGWKRIAVEIMIDHNYTRLALLAVTPLQIWVGWFFFSSMVTGVAEIIGPVRQLQTNSKYYTVIPAPRLKGVRLPHVTIQCPVYKESLWQTIHPTVTSLKKAISTYELQGGTANIFVNDDGMQAISRVEAEERRMYYEDNNISFVARPKHQPKGDETGANIFVRAGKFKKASNMNYALNVSVRVEDKLAQENRAPDWTQEDEDELYRGCLAEVLEEDEGRTWAEGNIRLGDYILLVDSDTRVPTDCFLDAVSEMELSPEVAILQYSSGVMNVSTSFFEKGITFFTNLIYTAIRYAVSNGDVTPFLGHNAILRWSAVQDVSYIGDGGVEKFWAENTVSEDFDMALRLQALGYILRFSVIHGSEFQEGVSLTVYDELARWEKYAYGCSELLFHPLKDWIFRGPFTPLFRRFIFSNMSLMSKITILSYMASYFAIAVSWLLTIMNYFLIGWFNGHLDHYYVDSFKIYFGIVVIFQALGTVSLAVLRYRIENRALIGSLIENLTWLLLLTCFLGGVSIHVSQAILCHLFSIDMSWGATAKEVTETTFFREMPVILRKFKFTFIFCIVTAATIVVMYGIGPLGHLVPHAFQIRDFVAIFPLGVLVGFHFLMPLVLNPGLMQFSF